MVYPIAVPKSKNSYHISTNNILVYKKWCWWTLQMLNTAVPLYYLVKLKKYPLLWYIRYSQTWWKYKCYIFYVWIWMAKYSSTGVNTLYSRVCIHSKKLTRKICNFLTIYVHINIYCMYIEIAILIYNSSFLFCLCIYTICIEIYLYAYF